MPLRIIKANEPITVERLNLCIYAPPGVCKTSLAFSAEAPLLFDFDNGVYRAIGRKDSVPAHKQTWTESSEMTAEDLEPYKTIVLDTAGRALDKLSADIISKNAKMGRPDGSLTLQGFGALKSRFSSYLKMLNNFGKDVVLICHMDEQRNGDDILERLDAQGSSKGEIYKSADAMGRIFIRQGKRYLDFSPREGSFGKNPGQLPELEIPHPDKNPLFLAQTIAAIKEKLNALTVDQLRAQVAIDEWNTAIDDLSGLEDFNRFLPEVKKAPEVSRSHFLNRAKNMGFVYSKKANAYEAAPERAHAG